MLRNTFVVATCLLVMTFWHNVSAEEEQPTSLLFVSQDERDVAFRSIDQILPTRPVLSGENVYPMPNALVEVELEYEVDGNSFSFSDFLEDRQLRGLLVWKDGEVVFEHYHPDHDAETRWVSFSVSKSVTSMLIGAAIQDGFIKSVDEPVVNYVSRFKGTGYEDSSIKDVLQMASGLAWDETYADPESDVSKAGSAIGVELVNYLAGKERDAKSGEKFNYNTGETNLVGEILRSAIGNNAATYLTHKIWTPFGMGGDAHWLLGSPGGGETGGCCISATLRDYARIGIFALGNGQLPDGTQVLPESWMKESTSPSKGYEGYGYLWWLGSEGRYSARGIYGQNIHINPESRVIVVTHSNAEAAVQTPYHEHLDAVIAALDANFSN